MATEPELKAIIKKERGGRWIEYHGPYKIGPADVWEIWTWTNENKKDKGDWTPQTRWWLEDENGSKLYFNYFSDLAPYLNKSKSQSKSTIEPGDLTIGQLISGLKPRQFWEMVVAAAFIILVALGLGAWLGLLHFW
jgi:hypothetical protein